MPNPIVAADIYYISTMRIYVNLKSVGKRKRGLEKTPYTVADGISTMRGLIEAAVRQGVADFNARGADNMLVDFLTEEAVADKAAAGKVGFGRLYSEKKADPGKAVAAAVQGFEDGLFRVLVNDTEAVELDAPLEIREDDVLTFIRLTFLAGRLW
jgi:hypothetical protein